MSNVASASRSEVTADGATNAPDAGLPTTIDGTLELVRADAYRYDGSLLRLVLAERVFRHIVSLRLNAFLCSKRGLFARILRAASLLYWHRARTLGFDVSPEAAIGPGLYVDPHPGGVVVHREARIGKNCNLHHGVTIGRKHRGPHAGAPRIGDNVWIGPGAKVVGSITVGSDAVIGPNCVVSEDVPVAAVLAAGRPQVLATTGSAGYVERPV